MEILPLLHGCKIIMGDWVKQLALNLPVGCRVVVITEEQVYARYRDGIEKKPVICISGGEAAKSWETVDRIVTELLELEVDRSTFIVGLGGGVVSDITGFVASIYMRGCRFAFIPTTLMAQVDAAIGGKNGINFKGYKNMLGTFRSPEFVVCDPSFLMSLHERDYLSGLSEIVKAGLIANTGLFDYLEENVRQLLGREREVLGFVIRESIRIKAEIVQADEKEENLRRLLNLGHTFAHALEAFREYHHGEAVSIGLSVITRISVKCGKLDAGTGKRIIELLTSLGLPTETDIPMISLLDTVRKDKKREGDGIYLVFPLAIGRSVVEKLSFTELEKLLED